MEGELPPVQKYPGWHKVPLIEPEPGEQALPGGALHTMHIDKDTAPKVEEYLPSGH